MIFLALGIACKYGLEINIGLRDCASGNMVVAASGPVDC